MTDKKLSVINIMKSHKGKEVTARYVSKLARLTTGETAGQLRKLADSGLIERILVNKREYNCLWIYKGGDE